MSEDQSVLISVVGPESTGKTTLSKALSGRFKGVWLPEYARSYLRKPEYDEQDLLGITKEQIARELDFVNAKPKLGILDTDAVVLYIWWQERFGHVPDLIVEHLKRQHARIYLLTAPDLPWEYDELRESRDDLNRLFEIYRSVLTQHGFSYHVVTGLNEHRLHSAVRAIEAASTSDNLVIT